MARSIRHFRAHCDAKNPIESAMHAGAAASGALGETSAADKEAYSTFWAAINKAGVGTSERQRVAHMDMGNGEGPIKATPAEVIERRRLHEAMAGVTHKLIIAAALAKSTSIQRQNRGSGSSKASAPKRAGVPDDEQPPLKRPSIREKKEARSSMAAAALAGAAHGDDSRTSSSKVFCDCACFLLHPQRPADPLPRLLGPFCGVDEQAPQLTTSVILM